MIYKYTIPLPPVTKKNSQRILVNRKTGMPFIAPSSAYKRYEEQAIYFLAPKPKTPLAGRLVRVMLDYEMDGATQEFSGSERILWPVMRRNLDIDHEFLEKQSKNSSKGGKSQNTTRNKPQAATHMQDGRDNMRKTTIPTPNEDAEQIALMQWAEMQSGKYPQLKMLFHIPNGGKRNPREAARFKQMGVKPGVPDLYLPIKRGEYYGLFVELKRQKGGIVSPYQRYWLQKLRAEGYAAEVCRGCNDAQGVILRYLTGQYQEREL